MKEKLDPWKIEALLNKTSCLHAVQHKRGGLTKISQLTCTD